MKHVTKRFTLVRAAVLLLLALTCEWASADNKIVVVSDTHVMAPSLLESGAETQSAWTTYYAGQRKMVQESAAIFDQFIDEVIVLHPKLLLITGDLTKDGEMLSHQYLRNKLQTLQTNGIKTLVIPGNHDFGAEGNHTKFKADGTTENAEVMPASQFADFYSGYGYGAGSIADPNGSLSYVAEPIEGLVVLGIDSHTASVETATLSWLCNKAEAARADGKQVLAMMHHPLFPHIEGANLFISTYTVNNYETVRNALIAAGVDVILTGHFHASDNAKDWNDNEDKAVYDLNTGSLISYPCDYRLLHYSDDLQSLKVEMASLVPQGMTADQCKEWLRGRVKALVVQAVKNKAGALASYITTQINNIAEYAANLFILHVEGDENDSADRAALAAGFENFKSDATYNLIFQYGGIQDATIYSILDDVSNYGNTHANRTADRLLSLIKGDVNGDCSVTITDAVGVVNYILDNPSDNFNKKNANVNGDTDGDGNPNITITDAVGIVNIILNSSGSSSAPAMAAPDDDEAVEPE